MRNDEATEDRELAHRLGLFNRIFKPVSEVGKAMKESLTLAADDLAAGAAVEDLKDSIADMDMFAKEAFRRLGLYGEIAAKVDDTMLDNLAESATDAPETVEAALAVLRDLKRLHARWEPRDPEGTEAA